MKKILKYALIFLTLSFLGIILIAANKEYIRDTVQNIPSFSAPCSKSIRYSLGEIDPKFEISRDQLLEIVSGAEKIWEEPAKKNLFQYAPEAEFKINLIFDERQRQADEAAKIENSLEKLGVEHESVSKEYDLLSKTYEQKLKEYNSQADAYEKKLSNYEDEVDKWNSRGGAPKDEYDKLQKEKKELEDAYRKLERNRQALDVLAGKTNQTAKKVNSLAGDYNDNLETYKNKFGSTREFEKGVYDGKAINIYEFEENSDLEMTIIHEMGHALGIGHLNNPDSIMYYLMGEQNLDDPKLTDEDLSALKNICRIN